MGTQKIPQDDRSASLDVGNVHISGRSVQNSFSDLTANDDRFSMGEGIHKTAAEAETGIREAIKAAQEKALLHVATGQFCTSTVTSLIVTPDKQLAWGSLGDSPAYLIVRDKSTGDVSIEQVTETGKKMIYPKPSMPIMKTVYEPVIGSKDLSEMLTDPNKEVYVLVTSDGALPEFVRESREFKARFSKAAAKDSLESMLTDLSTGLIIESEKVEKADGALADNISLVLAKIPSNIEKPITMTVCDASQGNSDFSNIICNEMQAELSPHNAQMGKAIEKAAEGIGFAAVSTPKTIRVTGRGAGGGRKRGG